MLIDPPIQNPIKRPVRLALYKSWTGSMDEGWTRYVFDTFNVPYTSLRDADVRAGNLRAKYDVIVLPSMRLREIVEGRAQETAPPEFTGGITEAGVAALRRFVEEGGTLVCFDASTELAIKRFNLPAPQRARRLALVGLLLPRLRPPARGRHRAPARAWASRASARRLLHQQRRLRGDRPGERVRVVARYAERKEDVLRSGWLLGAEQLAGRAALVEVDARPRPRRPLRLPPAAPRTDVGHLPLHLQRH